MALSEIRTYLVELVAGDQSGNTRARITLFDDKSNEIGLLAFVEDAPIPASVVTVGTIGYFSVARLADVVDLLRNERPVYLAVGASDVWLTTKPEPVGDGERLTASPFLPISKLGV